MTRIPTIAGAQSIPSSATIPALRNAVAHSVDAREPQKTRKWLWVALAAAAVLLLAGVAFFFLNLCC